MPYRRRTISGTARDLQQCCGRACRSTSSSRRSSDAQATAAAVAGAAGSGGYGSWLSANARVAPDLIEQSGEGPPPTPNLLLDDVVRSFEDGIGMLPTIAASRSNLSQPGMLPVIFTARDGTPTPTPGREGLTGSRTASNEPSKGAAAAAPAAAPPEVEVPEP